MREADGSLPINGAPYVTSAYTRQRMLKGWTIPVSCCWNGIASINAQPFLQGLQFRSDCRMLQCLITPMLNAAPQVLYAPESVAEPGQMLRS